MECSGMRWHIFDGLGPLLQWSAICVHHYSAKLQWRETGGEDPLAAWDAREVRALSQQEALDHRLISGCKTR